MDALSTKCPLCARFKNIHSQMKQVAARTEARTAFTREHCGGNSAVSLGTPKTHFQFTDNLTEFACPCYSFSTKYLAWTFLNSSEGTLRRTRIPAFPRPTAYKSDTPSNSVLGATAGYVTQRYGSGQSVPIPIDRLFPISLIQLTSSLSRFLAAPTVTGHTV